MDQIIHCYVPTRHQVKNVDSSGWGRNTVKTRKTSTIPFSSTFGLLISKFSFGPLVYHFNAKQQYLASKFHWHNVETNG